MIDQHVLFIALLIGWS